MFDDLSRRGTDNFSFQGPAPRVARRRRGSLRNETTMRFSGHGLDCELQCSGARSTLHRRGRLECNCRYSPNPEASDQPRPARSRQTRASSQDGCAGQRRCSRCLLRGHSSSGAGRPAQRRAVGQTANVGARLRGCVWFWETGDPEHCSILVSAGVCCTPCWAHRRRLSPHPVRAKHHCCAARCF
jgi:hypothetical protein